MSNAGKPPKAPSFNVKQILRRQDVLYEKLFLDADLVGRDLTGDELSRAMVALAGQFPGTDASVVAATLQPYAGTYLSYATCRDIAWRIAGNVSRLRDNEPVLTWTIQRDYEWVPVQIRSFESVLIKNKHKCMYTMKVLAGSPCTMTINDTWSRKFVGYVGRRIGFTAPWNKGPLKHPAELVNLRLIVYLDPTLSRPGQPRFKQLECPSGMLKWNKQLIGKRNWWLNKQPWYCPQGFQHRCYECHVGYLDCDASCHPTTREAT